MNLDYATATRRERRTRSGGSAPRFLLPAILALVVVLACLALDTRLRGPVSDPGKLAGRRDKRSEALSERAFLSAQVALASSDSINIILDARQARLWIALKGVKLRECRLSEIRYDGNVVRLVSGPEEALWLERPFILVSRRGSLPDPWKAVTEGPVDTTVGVMAMSERPMDGALVFDRDLVVHIKTPPTGADSLALRGLDGLSRRLSLRWKEAGEAWHEIVSGPPSMDIYLDISREDAAAILRALSVGGGMALRI